MPVATSHRSAVARSVATAPVMGVVRTHDRAEAEAHARALIAAGVELVEITFTVPGAESLAALLLAEAGGEGPPWIGMGTVTTRERAERAAAVGARFLVSPNVAPEVAAVARRHDLYLVLGALSPTEIVAAHELGADLVKVYPLPPVGGPRYLATVRQPLGDIPMLAGGGFPVEEIAAYRAAGASAFGIAAQLLDAGGPECAARVHAALAAARGEAGR